MLEEAEQACIEAGDCGAIATQSNVCNGQYRVSHGGPTFSAFFAQWETYALRSWESTPTECDTTAPVLTLAGQSPMEVSQGGTYVEPGCSVDDDLLECTVTGTVNTDVPGTYIITYTAVDEAGNVGTVTREVVVTGDNTGPVMTLNGESPMEIIQGGSYNELGCSTDGGEEVTITGSVDTNVPGTYTITYTATDQAGNVSTKTRDVIVTADNTAPVLTLTGQNPKEIYQGGSYVEPGCSSDGGEACTVTGSVNPNKPGTYTLTYTSVDQAGNVGTATREVIVHAACNNVLTQCKEHVDWAYNTGRNTDPSMYPEFAVVTGRSVANAAYADMQLYFYCKNTHNCADIGLLPPCNGEEIRPCQDAIAPVLTLNGESPMEIIQGGTYVERGVDADGGEGITITGTVDTNVPGTYIITYASTDAAGNVGTTTREVIVTADNTAPVLTLTGPSPMEVSQGGSYAEPGCSGDGGQFKCTVTGTVNTAVPGTYILTYTSVDQAGNVGTTTREVIVKDNTGPVMTLNGESPMEIPQGGSYDELGAFTDGGEEVSITGTVDCNVPGTYTITYTATDEAGNVSTKTREVIVK